MKEGIWISLSPDLATGIQIGLQHALLNQRQYGEARANRRLGPRTIRAPISCQYSPNQTIPTLCVFLGMNGITTWRLDPQ